MRLDGQERKGLRTGCEFHIMNINFTICTFTIVDNQ